MSVIVKNSPVALYRRTNDHNAEKIAHQGEILAKAVDDYGLEVKHDFIEYFAGLRRRPVLDDLLSRAHELGVKYLLVTDASRLTRGGIKELTGIVRRLNEAGISVYACADRALFEGMTLAIHAVVRTVNPGYALSAVPRCEHCGHTLKAD